MKPQPNNAFDFDEWSSLARTDPEAFETRRQAMIHEFIDSVPAHRRRRLHGLQWRLDAERLRARTPLAACVRLQSLMVGQVQGELLPALRALIGPAADHPAPRADARPRAEVIPLHRPGDRA